MAQLKELPFEIEAPGASKKPTPMMERETPAEEAGEGKIPGYVEPWQRCANCEYFAGEKQYCNKFKAPADMDGYCPSWEEPDEGGEEEEASEGYGKEGEEGDE